VGASAKCNASCLVCNVVIYMCVSPDRSYTGVGVHVLCDMCLIPLGLRRLTSFASTHYGGRHCIRSFLGTAEFTKLKVNLEWHKHHAQDNVPYSYHPGLTPSKMRKKNNLAAAATIVGEPAQTATHNRHGAVGQQIQEARGQPRTSTHNRRGSVGPHKLRMPKTDSIGTKRMRGGGMVLLIISDGAQELTGVSRTTLG
jgi:hypothetical protein